jgi:hypothetical protein
MEEMPHPPISTAEWVYVKERVRPLMNAINETSHRQQHVATTAHEMPLHLPVNERYGAVAYLMRVMRLGLN